MAAYCNDEPPGAQIISTAEAITQERVLLEVVTGTGKSRVVKVGLCWLASGAA